MNRYSVYKNNNSKKTPTKTHRSCISRQCLNQNNLIANFEIASYVSSSSIKKSFFNEGMNENEDIKFNSSYCKMHYYKNDIGTRKNRKKSRKGETQVRKKNTTNSEFCNFEIVQYLSNYRLQFSMFSKWKKHFNNNWIKCICDNSYDSINIDHLKEENNSETDNPKCQLNHSNSYNNYKNDISKNQINDFDLYIPENILDFRNLPDLITLSDNLDSKNMNQELNNEKIDSQKTKVSLIFEDEIDNIIDSMFSEN